MNGKNNYILITGAGGVLGSELIRQLIKNGEYQILALDIDKKVFPESLADHDLIELYDSKEWVENKLPWNKINSVIHCAFARSSNGRLLSESLDFTKELLSQVVKNRVDTFVNISSQSVYGRSQSPLWTEKTPVSPEPPDTFYALTKYASELLTTSICNSGESKTIGTNLRLASLIGRGMDERLVTRFVKAALTDEPIKLVGGNQVMAYMDVRDAAEGIIALMQTDTSVWKDVYNFGVPWRYTIREIAEIVKKIGKTYGKEVQIEIEEKDVSLDTGMDTSLFYRDTGWRPKYDISMTIDYLFKSLFDQGMALV